MKRVPLVVWAALAVHTVLLVWWSFAMPTFRSPDEPNHIDLVRMLVADPAYPDFDARRTDGHVLAALDEVAFARRSRALERGAARPRSERPAFDDLTPKPETELNQIPQHPPLYYEVEAAAFRLVRTVLPDRAVRSYDREVGVFRLLSALWMLPLPLCAWWAARRSGARRPELAALLLLGVPQLYHVGSAVTNDTMFIGLSALLTCLLVAVATGDLRPRTLVGAGAVCGLAMFTKGFGLTFPIWVAVAVFVGRRRDDARVGPRGLWVSLLAATGAAFATGGWWWLRNVVRFGTLAPSVELSHRLASVDGFTPDWAHWVREAVLGTGKRFWGNFGWYDTWIPYSVMVLCWVALGATVVAACITARPRAVVVVLVTPFVLLVAFLALNAARLYARSGVFALLQGRYLFGGLVGLAAIGALAADRLRSRLVAPAVVLGAAALQALAVRAVLRYYWAGRGPVAQLRSLVAWSPWPPAVSVLWVLAAIAAVGVLGVALVRGPGSAT